MSKFLRGLGTLIGIVGGIYGFVMSLLVIYMEFGGGGVFLGLFIFPLTFALIPFYTLFVYGSWTLLIINYGSSLAYWLLHSIADRRDIQENEQKSNVEPIGLAAMQVRTPESSSKNNPWVGFVVLIIGGLILAVIFSSLSSSTAPVSTTTRTPQPTRTPTRVVISTRTQRPVSLQACVTNETIRIRKGPGTEYEAVDGLVSGTCMSILGRNSDSTWVYMVSEDNKTGWVAAWLLTIDGDLNRVSVRSGTQVFSAAPTQKVIPTQKPPPTATRKPIIFFTSTPKTISSAIPCSQADNFIGESIVCIIERADCDYRPDVDGSPTFCNDRPYPNQKFTLVVFEEDWSDLDGRCILVSGRVYMYGGVPQIQGLSRSQVSYCQ